MREASSPSRIGVVVPSVNTVIEAWYPHAFPPDVSLATARMLIGASVTKESLREMDGHGLEAAKGLATCRPDVIVYGCTASSLVGGREYDLHLMEEMTRETGITTLTTTESVLRALAHLNVTTLAVASPYTEELGGAEVRFLVDNGHPVLSHAHLGILGGFDLAAPTGDEIREVGLRAWHDSKGKADALFIGCMNMRSHLVLEDLEAEIGAPVVSATQASLWAALGEMGSRAAIPGYGRLLREPRASAFATP